MVFLCICFRRERTFYDPFRLERMRLSRFLVHYSSFAPYVLQHLPRRPPYTFEELDSHLRPVLR
jgi:hypothetical protein